jgi:hypothetical protein
MSTARKLQRPTERQRSDAPVKKLPDKYVLCAGCSQKDGRHPNTIRDRKTGEPVSFDVLRKEGIDPESGQSHGMCGKCEKEMRDQLEARRSRLEKETGRKFKLPSEEPRD